MSDVTAAPAPRSLSIRNRVHAVVLAVLMAVAVGHQLLPGLYEWFIEDAAISFSFARNLAEGEGLVAYPGGERVEGFSNPTWVYLIGVLAYFGIDPFAAAKFLAGMFGALTVPLVYLITREALPSHKSGDAALIGALAFAVNSQAAIWAASGLENSLFNFLLAAAMWRTLVEVRRGGLPASAFLFFLLAITRPEALMYAAIGGFFSMVWHWQSGRGFKPTLAWLVAFWLPFGVYYAWRFAYFAWELPNTAYAKDRNHNMRNWAAFRGWKQLRGWSHDVWHLYFFPLYVGGVATLRGWRGPLALLMTLVTVSLLLYPETETLRTLVPDWPKLPAPTWWARMKPYLVLVFALSVPVLGLGAVKGWRARVFAWVMLCATVFFAVWSNGDWMKGYRWYSLLAVQVSVLFGVGVTEVADGVQRCLSRQRERWTLPGYVVAVILAGLVVPANALYTDHWLIKRETGPFAVRKRVNYMLYVKNRLWLDRVVAWDVDQGAHLFWSGFEMMDMAGLVDVPVAHHRYEKPFIKEHFFQEGRPHFAHVHGGWANTSRIPSHPEWRSDYVEIPGYPAGKRALHIGNHIRRDLLLAKAWRGRTDRKVEFEDGITLVSWDVPSPETARARSWYVEVALQSRDREANQNFRVLVFLSNGTQLQSWDVPPGYDWVMPHEWRFDDVFLGKYGLELNKPLGLGDYALGFVVVDGSGQPVWPSRGEDGEWVSLPEGAVVGGVDGEPALFMEGEVRWPDAFHIVSVEENASNAREDRERAYKTAAKLECEAAEVWWFKARMHRPKNMQWRAEFEPAVSRALAECWSGRALKNPDEEVVALEKARGWDRHSPAYQTAAKPVADALYTRGLAARELGDAETAYRLFTDVLRVDIQRSWARRYAEEMRDIRLGLDPESKEAKRRAAEERRLRVEERRSRLKQELKTPDKAEEAEAPEEEDAPAPRPEGPEAE